MKLPLLTLLCFALCSSCYQSVGSQLSRLEYSKNNTPDLPPNAEPGKCYAKSLITDEVVENGRKIPVYTGDENDDTVKRALKEYVLRESTTKWIKRKTDRNCLSQDPNDCLVWCLIEVPAEKIERMVVLDTTNTSSYEMETIYFTDVKQKGGFTKWFEVLCEKDVDSNITLQIKEALLIRNFLDEMPEGDKICSKTKQGLQQFQKENSLPVGNLDFETLTSLNIEY